MKILLNGICGRMGKEVEKLALTGYRGAELVGGVDPNGETASVPVFADFDSVNVDFDCIVDFSFHASAPALCEYAKKVGKPVIIATTGHTDEEKKIIEKERKRSQNWLDIQDLEINYSVTSVFRIYLTESSFLQ